jgi:hypothetical protein
MADSNTGCAASLVGLHLPKIYSGRQNTSLVLRYVLILGLAALALATVASQKPGLTPKRLWFPNPIS